MQIPKTIHQIWIGDRPIPENHKSWIDHTRWMNPEWKHILWDDLALTSAGFLVGDFVRSYWSYASASNMIRLLLLRRYGGIYLDTDCECLKPLDKLLNRKAFAAFQDGDRICNAVMGAEPDHPWIKWQIEHGAGDTDPHDAAWGVYTASKAPRDLVSIIPTHWVYPFHYSTPLSRRENHQDSFIAHHWDGSWTKNAN